MIPPYVVAVIDQFDAGLRDGLSASESAKRVRCPHGCGHSIAEGPCCGRIRGLIRSGRWYGP